MKRSHVDTVRGALVIMAVLALAVPERADAGLRIAWDHCGDAGASTKSFACSSNAGSDVLVISFLPSSPIPKLAHADVWVNVCFASNGLPAWWQVLGVSSCRLGSLTITGTSPSDGCEQAWDPSSGSTQTILGVTSNVRNGFEFVVRVTAADTTKARDLIAGQEVALFRVVLDHAGTVGAGACTGCTIAADVRADYVWLYNTDGGNVGTGSSSWVTWQDPSMYCQSVVPVRNSTWGRVKSLYR